MIIKKGKAMFNSFLNNPRQLYEGCQQRNIEMSYQTKEMIIGVHLMLYQDKKWHTTDEIILTAIHNGFEYHGRIPKFKNYRSLQIMCKKFVNKVLKDEYDLKW